MSDAIYLFQSHNSAAVFQTRYSRGIYIKVQCLTPHVPGVTDVALIILKYQLVVVHPQVVFGWETMCIFAASAHPQACIRIRINPVIKIFMLELFCGLAMAIETVSEHLGCE